MSRFDHAAADKARAANPALTIFDTGQMLEPEIETTRVSIPHPKANTVATSVVRKTGLVTFTNDESAPVLTVLAHPSAVEEDTTLVQIEASGPGRFKIMLNNGQLFNGDIDEQRDHKSAAQLVATAANHSGSTRAEAIDRLAELFGLSFDDDTLEWSVTP